MLGSIKQIMFDIDFQNFVCRCNFATLDSQNKPKIGVGQVVTNKAVLSETRTKQTKF